ncbi:hypothetical protein SALB1_2652 [Salinisphaera sp. LB1]|nr:hypothetical protein SALB1_2652 [Salinisphaera sp. LB1]
MIELMIVLVIAAILAVVAYKFYVSYVGSAQNSHAKATMLETTQPMPPHYVAHSKYRGQPSVLLLGVRTRSSSTVADQSA